MPVFILWRLTLFLHLTSATDNYKPMPYLRSPSISSIDGTIAFTYAGDIWTVSKDGGEAGQITSHINYDDIPRFSPDGKQIAFQTTVKSAGKKYDDEICIVDIDSKNLFRLTNSPGWDTMPHWSSLPLKEIKKK